MVVRAFFFVLALLMLSVAAFAAVEPDYDPAKPPVTNPWFATQGAAERLADLEYISGMRPHHAGALSMSEEYLNDSKAGDAALKNLARGIIHNQKFEIGMLDRVEELVGKPIDGASEWRQVAEKGLAQKQRFVRAPLPVGWRTGNMTARDVQFAKAMIVHHEGALIMCNDYLKNPAAKNKYLRLMCVDIKKDQKIEIDFMNKSIGRYPGNPDDVKIDASMIHGMEGMSHGHGGHGSHATKPKAAAPKKAAPATDHSHSQHHGHH